MKLTLASGNTFTSGTKQRWTVTVSDSNTSYRTGFQLTATAGTFTAVTATTMMTSSGKQYVTHSSSTSSYVFDWTPPTDATSTVTVYVAGAAVNGTRQGNVYTSAATLTKSTAKPAVTSVVNAASFGAGIEAGSWVTVYGSNLAPAGVARAWTESEIVAGAFPTSLEGTQVKINGKSAAIAYVSEGQLNVQAPDDTALGSVAVEVVTSAGGTSDGFTANLASAAPGLFRFAPSSYRYAAAVFADGTLAAPSGLFGSTVGSRAAAPGETVVLFGTGFGATNPAVPAGVTYLGAAPLASGNALAVRIGGVQAEVAFAGLSAAGLYQFNVVVPNVADGEWPVEASAWGIAVPTTQYLAVKK